MTSSMTVLCGALLTAATLSASPLTVVSYDMLNGERHTKTYFDYSYNGSGDHTTSLSPLTGGTGVLTDGLTGTSDFFGNLTPTVPQQAVEWVAWALNPFFAPVPLDTNDTFATVTFKFASPSIFNTVSLFANNGFNEPGGGVSMFGTAVIDFSNDGTTFHDQFTYTTTTADRDSTQQAHFIPVAVTDANSWQYVRVHLTHNDNWVFLSEVTFDGSSGAATPEPASLGLLAAGLLLAVARVRRPRAC